MTPVRPTPRLVAPSPELILSFRQHLRECQRCELHTNTGGPIPWSGDVNPRYAILGEAPGRTEAAKQVPFVGDSGAILRHWLKEVGIDLSSIAFLNSCACYPAAQKTPKKVNLDACRPWTNGQLEFIRPGILITVGNIAFNQIRHPHPWPKLQVLHGKPMFHPRFHMPVFSTYHPAAFLRGKSKRYEKMILDDLAVVAGWDGEYLSECAVCGDELYRYDDWGIGFCARHSSRQGLLFPEDVGAAT